MKKFKSIFNRLFFTAALLTAPIANSFAQDQQNQGGQNITNPPQRPLVNISGSLNTISNTLVEMYNKMVAMSSKLNYSTNNFIQALISSTQQVSSAQAITENSTNNTLINLIQYYLTGLDVKKQTSSLLATTNVSYAYIPQSGTYRSIVFNPTTNVPDASDQQNQMNVDSLIGTLQYNSAQQSNAQAYIGMIETLAPPPTVINITDTKPITVPYSTNPSASSTTDVTLGKDTVTLSDLMTYLQGQSAYKKYLLNYRKTIAARSIYMRTLLDSYQRRVAPSDSTPSLAQQDYDDANQFFTGNNADQATAGPPAAVLRNILTYLAKIHKDNYEIKQQNEQLLVLQAVSGLQTMSFSSMFSSNNTKTVGQMIYCQAHKTDTHCPQQTTTSTTTTTTGTGTTSTTSQNATPTPTTPNTESGMSQLQSQSTQSQQQSTLPSMDVTDDSSV